MQPEAILIDEMFTLFVPKHGMSRYVLYQLVIKKVLKRDVSLDEIKISYERQRKLLEKNLPPPHGYIWTIIVAGVLLDLFPDLTFDEAILAGVKINEQILGNGDLYEMSRESLDFLYEARKRNIKVILSSNHDREKLRKLIWYFRLGHLIHKVYTSSDVGYEKPNPSFFQSILYKENLLAQECIMIGNNPINDIAGAEAVKIRGVLLDHQGRFPNFTGIKIKNLTEIWNLTEIF